MLLPSKKWISTCIFFLLLILILVASFFGAKENIFAQVSQPVTISVYHLCTSAAIEDVNIRCESDFAGAGTKRALPGTEQQQQFIVWFCDSTDPQVYQPYDNELNYGCGRDPISGNWHYPDGWSNPITLDVETYLYDVITPEMDPDDYPAVAVQAQAVAARTKALRSGSFDNSNAFQVYFPNTGKLSGIPIVDSTAGQVIHYAGNLVAAQFSADHAGEWTTQNFYYPDANQHLKSIYDPEGRGGAHGEGLSQLGACRWVTGYDLAQANLVGEGCIWQDQSEKYPEWKGYRQILAHYYTGIDIVDANGVQLAPALRWNPIVVDAPTTMQAGQSTNIPVIVQNSGKVAWDISAEITYWWEDTNGQVIPATITPLTINDVVEPGEVPGEIAGQQNTPIPLNLLVAAPNNVISGDYFLVLDMQQGGNLFSSSGWFSHKITQVATL